MDETRQKKQAGRKKGEDGEWKKATASVESQTRKEILERIQLFLLSFSQLSNVTPYSSVDQG